MLLNEFVFYSFLGGGAVFLAAYYATQKSKGFAWIAAIALAVVAVLFVFPGAVNVKTLGDAASNATVFIQKATYLVAWFIGPALLTKFLP
ncbi:hypothetical protein N5J43_07075 [Pseudomonas nicosulfuronedens]|uniref:hypothetical protein n=1 Tax=Pseudomonas nicosulfuronedens TaxID=2571105 RepID=UPI002447A648|nr:hypothetical protein [Pseudomonas nicosulfuronedens]MDH1009344.1 hypothetical protein [Pseudomonas nicosulfuronedens]MDH1978706.1 hypothetical protein [Pseudomonas nicosulfuronedens]MDH2026432.1 hypothetical protein [Pseudomonas nicosulfuronedens]